jgi:hypothetical protein
MAEDPLAQRLRELAGRDSPRRWQLFACACCYRILPLLVDARSRHAVAVAERSADGLASEEEMAEAFQHACEAEVQAWQPGGPRALAFAATAARQALYAPRSAYRAAVSATGSGEPDEAAAQVRLLDDLFGPEVAFAPAWRTALTLAMAQAAYTHQDFTALPILADALEEAGCDERVLLDHLRENREHVRGCWAIDAVLEKD